MPRTLSTPRAAALAGVLFALLFAAIPLGSVVGGVFSGWVGRIRRQGLAVIICILIWGVATVVLQLLAFRVVDALLTGLPQRIEHGEAPAAIVLVGAKLATALILAAALTG